MRVLVTGAAGFIGRPLVAALAGELYAASVCSVVRTRAPGVAGHMVAADLSSPGWTAAIPDETFDIVVHLAQSRHFREFPARTTDIVAVNVGATVELASWAVTHGVRRFVFASTANVYGTTAGLLGEDEVCRPQGMYAASKRSAELLLEPFAAHVEVLVLRIFGAYGAGQASGMLPGVMQRFDAGDEITLAGGIGVRYSPLHVDDCARVIADLACRATAPGYQIVNVAGDEVIDLRQVIELLEAETGRTVRVRDTSDRPVELVGRTDRLRALSTERPRTAFRDGLLGAYRARATQGTS